MSQKKAFAVGMDSWTFLLAVSLRREVLRRAEQKVGHRRASGQSVPRGARDSSAADGLLNGTNTPRKTTNNNHCQTQDKVPCGGGMPPPNRPPKASHNYTTVLKQINIH